MTFRACPVSVDDAVVVASETACVVVPHLHDGGGDHRGLGRGEHVVEELHVADWCGSNADPHRAKTEVFQFGGVRDA
ncbi:hypothetical protein CIW49_29970 [Mycolicibacterium sp. P1-18]|uniref:hypothetical protein n=1 Tax=Mycolicibacterium sp. P1-18 TaxID=2024615 RepID=UPI0011F3B055|nr:hypothetical protein [Mycolicibacterium sp. P1-18]KAA0092067.1 hypothetical protein CIW49_29970 [Mycolicibacterium sp. P1-18]